MEKRHQKGVTWGQALEGLFFNFFLREKQQSLCVLLTNQVSLNFNLTNPENGTQEETV